MATSDITGNDYVSLPSIRTDGGIEAVTVLHGGLGGLIEWAGGEDAPLLRLAVEIDGVAVDLSAARWQRLDRWIPTFRVTLPDGGTLHGVICAPAGYPAGRGFFIRVDFESKARAPQRLRAGLDITWDRTNLHVASARPLAGPNMLLVDRAGPLITLESDGGRGPALAVTATGATVQAPTDDGRGSTARLTATIERTMDAAPQRRTGVTFFVGAGRERDGASAACRALKRLGADGLLRQARLELSHTLRAGRDHRWAELLNRNLVFCRFFAVGRGIDDDRLYLLRSRSPRCTAPGLFNETEALFWTLPALIIAEPGIAREALLRTIETFSERSGEYLRYIDGGAFDAGFVLEQFLLYPWAIDHYVTTTGDASLAEELPSQQIVMETDTGAFLRLHREHLLAGTELLPSGDAADFPFTTLGNALLRCFSDALGRLPWPNPPEPAPRLAGAAAEVTAAVWRHCLSEVDGEPVLACSADLAGQAAVYDDPAMSLGLLPFLGFCDVEDPVWTGTMEFLRSNRYPLWLEGRVPGLAARSQPELARLSALCADLLGPAARDALDRLLLLQLPDGVAATAWDPGTGRCHGPHDAALAGFLAWSLARATESAPRSESRGRRR